MKDGSIDESGRDPGVFVNVTCQPGYTLNIATTSKDTYLEIVCDPRGKWIPGIPDCSGKELN